MRPYLNTSTFTETQWIVAPSGSGATAAFAAATAAILLVLLLGRRRAACKFVLEGEGVRPVSGVEGMWMAGMGAADAALSRTPFSEMLVAACADGVISASDPAEREEGLR